MKCGDCQFAAALQNGCLRCLLIHTTGVAGRLARGVPYSVASEGWGRSLCYPQDECHNPALWQMARHESKPEPKTTPWAEDIYNACETVAKLLPVGTTVILLQSKFAGQRAVVSRIDVRRFSDDIRVEFLCVDNAAPRVVFSLYGCALKSGNLKEIIDGFCRVVWTPGGSK